MGVGAGAGAARGTGAGGRGRDRDIDPWAHPRASPGLRCSCAAAKAVVAPGRIRGTGW